MTILTFTVNGVALPPGAVDVSSFKISDSTNKRSTCAFNIFDANGAMSFVEGMPVAVTDDGGNTLFSGLILPPVQVTFITQRSPGLVHQIACGDWHVIAERRIIFKSYAGMTSDAIVRDIFNTYLAGEGLTLGTISAGPSVAQLNFNYVYVSDAMDALAQLSGFLWYITYEKEIMFLPITANTAPWTLTPAQCLVATMPTLSQGTQDYRNVEYIKGGKDITSTQTQYFYGDGKTQSWSLGYPVNSVSSITVNGAAQTIGDKNASTSSTAQFYYSMNDPVIAQDTRQAPLQSTAILAVTYTGVINIVSKSQNSTAIAQRQAIEGGGTGIWEHCISDTTISNSQTAIQLGNAYLDEYCQNARKFEFITTTPGLAAAQMLTVQLPQLANYGLADTRMLIESVTVSAETVVQNGSAGSMIFYDVVAILGPIDDTWTAFFAKVLKQNAVNLSDQDSTLILVSTFDDEWAFTDNVPPPAVLAGGLAYLLASGNAWQCPLLANYTNARTAVI